MPISGGNPMSITNAPDGALRSVHEGGKNGGISVAGVITHVFEVPQAAVYTPPWNVGLYFRFYPTSLIVGPDGALWFVTNGPNKIVRMTFDGQFTIHSVPTFTASPHFLANGSDGALWFTEFNGNKVGRITTAGNITEYPIPTPNTQPQGLAFGPDGSLWFTERNGGKNGVMPRPPSL